MNNKGVSGVIGTVLLIGLVVVVIAVVWGVVMNLVNKNIESTSSCFGNFNKIELNSQYTCYDEDTGEFSFSINVGDIELEKIIVFISGNRITKSIELSEKELSEAYLRPYGGDWGDAVTKPNSNSGKTYVIDLSDSEVDINEKPDVVKISPVISGTQCEVADTLSIIEPCQTTI